VLRLHQIATLFAAGDHEQALERSDALLRDPDANIEAKFWASLQGFNIRYLRLAKSCKPQEQLPTYRLEHAKALQDLTRSAEQKAFKFYALIARKAAELEVLTHENFRQSMLQKAHLQKGGEPLIVWRIYARRAWLAKVITTKYNQCVRLSRYAAGSRNPWLLGRAIKNITEAIGVYTAVLQLEGDTELEAVFSQSAFQLSKVAYFICECTKDQAGAAQVISGSILVVHDDKSEIFRWALTSAKKITDLVTREHTLEVLSRASRRWRGERVEGDYRGDTMWQAYQNLASARGIDISDEKSPLALSLRVALKDKDPTRVLRNCQSLTISYGAVGPMARRLHDLFNLATADSKFIHCTRHNFHVEGKELDSTYTAFERLHCSVCHDRKQRPRDWHYDGVPTEEEASFLVGLIGTPFDMRLVD
jgi:hypothetical protein